MTVEVIQPRSLTKSAAKVSRLELKQHRAEMDNRLLIELLKNPAFQIIATFVIIEVLQKQKIIPETAGTFAEGGVLTAVAYQQLAPLMPDLLKAGTEGFKALAGLIPAVAGMAAKGG